MGRKEVGGEGRGAVWMSVGGGALDVTTSVEGGRTVSGGKEVVGSGGGGFEWRERHEGCCWAGSSCSKAGSFE